MTTDLERTEELYAFLQGEVPTGYRIAEVPRLSAEQAWTVIWYLGNQYWQVTDHIERCEVCEDLFDTDVEGECLDYGEPPYHFCGDCEDGPDAVLKRRRERAAQKREVKRQARERRSR